MMKTSWISLLFVFCLLSCNEPRIQADVTNSRDQIAGDSLGSLSGIDYCALAPHNFEDGVEQSNFNRMRLSDHVNLDSRVIGWFFDEESDDITITLKEEIEWKTHSSDPTTFPRTSGKVNVFADGINAILRLSYPTDLSSSLDPSSLQNFFENGFAISLQFFDAQSRIGIPDGWWVTYAPCAERAVSDDFVFEFKNGDVLTASIVSVNGSFGNGYYVGFLKLLSGRLDGESFYMSGFDRLYMHGSTRSWAEPTIPVLSARWLEVPEAGTCGILFSTRSWYTSEAVRGYSVYDLSCDGKLGQIRPLLKVSYPEKYVLP